MQIKFIDEPWPSESNEIPPETVLYGMEKYGDNWFVKYDGLMVFDVYPSDAEFVNGEPQGCVGQEVYQIIKKDGEWGTVGLSVEVSGET